MKTRFFLAGCLAAGLALPALAAAPSAMQSFDDGVAAYRAGRYAVALEAFRAAQRRGLDDTNLLMNLGLTLYQLGRYDEARDAFTRARSDLRYTALADYHLGLIDLALGDRRSAASRFSAVEAFSDVPQIGTHAGAALRELDTTAALPEPDLATAATARGSVDYLRLATGYDSNPELIGDSVDQPRGNLGAGYAEIVGALDHPLHTGALGTTRFSLQGGLRQHADSEGFDRESGQLALSQGIDAGSWLLEGGLDVGTAWLSWETYQNSWGAAFDGRHALGETLLQLGYDVQRIDGQGAFSYLDGWQHRVAAEASRLVGAFRARVGLDAEKDDRRDLAQGPEFSSYSPTRLGAAVALGALPRGRLSLEWRARYRNSRYADPDRFLVNAALVEQRRVDNLAATGVRARYRGGERWSWIVDYEYSHNASSIPEFSYARHEAALGIEWLR